MLEGQLVDVRGQLEAALCEQKLALKQMAEAQDGRREVRQAARAIPEHVQGSGSAVSPGSFARHTHQRISRSG